jgi:hypothetical protein
MAAERDTQKDVNGVLWFFSGCISGPTGVIIAYVYQPSPPALRLLGKSPEYIAFYTDAYRAKAKSIQTSRAWAGCIALSIAYIAYIVVFIFREGIGD